MQRRIRRGPAVHRHPLTLGAVATLFLTCSAAGAADSGSAPATVLPASQARYRIDQPAQPLSEFLRSIAARTGTSVLFDPAAVGDRVSPPVRGQLSAAEAISKALAGSGLEWIVMPDGAIVVRAVPATVGTPVKRAASAALIQTDPGESVALVGGASAAAASAFNGELAGAATSPREGDAVGSLTRVEVTGSRLKRIDADGPAPVNVYSRAEIDRSGQPTLERFISSLNEASVSSGEGSAGQTIGQGSVQLRGLPLGSSLVLINGRRVQAVGSGSGNYFNLNLIPMAAVERVEIVPVGSSAVYGGDALAGVVNVILKKAIDGVVLDAHVASGKGTSERAVSLGTGAHGASGSFLLLGSYSKTTPLTAGERSFFVDGDYQRFGGVDARTGLCTPGTVSSASGANLPGLNASIAGLPVLGPDRMPTVRDFAPNAGQPNLCNPLSNGRGTALVFGTENLALHATAEAPMGASWQSFAEATLTKDKISAEQYGLLLSNTLVPATNPYNPFGVDVRVNGRLGLDNGAEGFARDTDFKRLLIGARGELREGWDAEVSVSTSRDDGDRVQRNTSVNSAALAAALSATLPTKALNPFASARAASDEVLRSIWTDATRENHGRKDQVSAFVRGATMELPSGAVDVIAGAEASRDQIRSTVPGSYDIHGKRSSHAMFGEARVPLWRTPEGGGPSREAAALTLAARRDHYSDFGSANTYQAGLEMRPSRTTLLRGSVATSFKPPTLVQTHINDESYPIEIFGLTDPSRGNAPITEGVLVRAANPALQPERGRAYSLGAVWEPETGAGPGNATRLAVTAWRVKIHGLISLLSPQVVLDNEALFPGLISRDPGDGGLPGPVSQVMYSEVNFGGVDTAGADMEFSQAWRSGGTRWTLSGGATRTMRYDVVLAPGAMTEDRLGRRALDYWAPRWKGRVFAGLDRGGWNVGLTGRFLGSYRDVAPGERGLGNFWVFDAAASVDLQRMGLRVPLVKSSQLSLAIANLLDRQPQYVGSWPYYDVTQADWRGRYANVRLSMSW